MGRGTGTEEYYRRRSAEYDAVYDKPERQNDLAVLRPEIGRLLAGHRVLEVAAGTGWWTDVYADAVATVTATDVNEATLEVAAGRREWPAAVSFVEVDAFALEAVSGSFDAAFVGFFWSHVPVTRIDVFLEGLVARLDPGALVVIMDNRFVDGSNHAITRTDEAGNTYQRRHLADGTSWEVLKNFPTAEELHSRLVRFAVGVVNVRELDYYWLATFEVPNGTA